MYLKFNNQISWLCARLVLKEYVINTEFTNHQVYKTYRFDMKDVQGGVLLMVKREIWSTNRKDLKSTNPNHNKIVATEIRPHSGRRIPVLSVNRCQADPSNLKHIFQQGCQDGIQEFLILVNLNYREIKWIEDVEENIPAHCIHH